MKNATRLTLPYQHGFMCVISNSEDSFVLSFFFLFIFRIEFLFFFFFGKVSLAWLLESIQSYMKCIAIDWTKKENIAPIWYIECVCRLWSGSKQASKLAQNTVWVNVKCKGSNKSASTYVIHDPAMVFMLIFI